ncbi:MAG: hypothetical protein HDS94_02285 [Bacteroidales bacterium]|nr:hypothetical protein [Bacteroidales bacterium]
MKKLLLVSALAMAACSANAEGFGDYFKMTYNGEELTEGKEIVVTHHDGYAYECIIPIENLQGKKATLFGAMEYTGQPSYEMLQSNQAEWGFPMFCTGGGQCWGMTAESVGQGNYEIPAESDPLNMPTWQIHLNCNTPLSNISKYNLFFAPLDDNGERIDGAELNVTLIFGDGNNAVGEINVADEAPVYYNLQGQKVDNPENGIYLVKRAGKVTKEVIR